MSPAAELPRAVTLDRIGSAGLVESVTADAAERAAIAKRLMVPDVAALTCEWVLEPMPGGMVHASGRLRARVTQECVVTLEPFAVAVTEDFSLRFVPDGSESEDDGDPDSEDEVPFAGNVIDLGEATVQQLALALDPFPRKPGAALPDLLPPELSAATADAAPDGDGKLAAALRKLAARRGNS